MVLWLLSEIMIDRLWTLVTWWNGSCVSALLRSWNVFCFRSELLLEKNKVLPVVSIQRQVVVAQKCIDCAWTRKTFWLNTLRSLSQVRVAIYTSTEYSCIETTSRVTELLDMLLLRTYLHGKMVQRFCVINETLFFKDLYVWASISSKVAIELDLWFV